jgi:hypothetical protein
MAGIAQQRPVIVLVHLHDVHQNPQILLLRQPGLVNKIGHALRRSGTGPIAKPRSMKGVNILQSLLPGGFVLHAQSGTVDSDLRKLRCQRRGWSRDKSFAGAIQGLCHSSRRRESARHNSHILRRRQRGPSLYLPCNSLLRSKLRAANLKEAASISRISATCATVNPQLLAYPSRSCKNRSTSFSLANSCASRISMGLIFTQLAAIRSRAVALVRWPAPRAPSPSAREAQQSPGSDRRAR